MTNPNLGRPVANRYAVPAKQWNRWNNHGRKTYNDIMHMLRPSMQVIFNAHPRTTLLTKAHWDTLRQNVAWEVADLVGRKPRKAKKHVKSKSPRSR